MKPFLSIFFLLLVSSTQAQLFRKPAGQRDTIFGYTGVMQTDGSLKIDSSGIKMRKPTAPGKIPKFEYPEGKDLTKRAKKIVEELGKQIDELKIKGKANEGADMQTAMALSDALKEVREDAKNDMQELALPPIEIEVPQMPTLAKKLRKFYLMNKAKYNEINEFYKLHRRDRDSDLPLAPTPPDSDMECWDCTGEKRRQFEEEKKVYLCTFFEFINTEISYIKFLLDCSRVYQVLTEHQLRDWRELGSAVDEPFAREEPEYNDANDFFRECSMMMGAGKVQFLLDRISMIGNRAWKTYTGDGQTIALAPIMLAIERQNQLFGSSGNDRTLIESASRIQKVLDKLLDKFYSEHDYFTFCSIKTIGGLTRTIAIMTGGDFGSMHRNLYDIAFFANKFQLTIEAQTKIQQGADYIIGHIQIKGDVKMTLIPQEITKNEQEEKRRYDALPTRVKEELYPCGREFKADYPDAKLIFELEDVKDQAEGKVLNGEILTKDEKGQPFKSIYQSPKSFEPTVKLRIHDKCSNADEPDSILISGLTAKKAESWSGMQYATGSLFGTIAAVFSQKQMIGAAATAMELSQEDMLRKAQELKAMTMNRNGGSLDNLSEKQLRDIMSAGTKYADNILKGQMIIGNILKVSFQNKSVTPINERIEASSLQEQPLSGMIYGYITVKLTYKGGR